jgi:hypothetical protein
MIESLGQDIWIGYFLGLDRPKEGLDQLLQELMHEIGPKFLTIAIEGGGNELLLDLENGEISYWDSCRHYEQSTDGRDRYLAANSFSEMLEKFHPFPDDVV